MADFIEGQYESTDDITLPACFNCRFWSSYEALSNNKEYRGIGYCLRHAPQPQPRRIVGDGFMKMNWPVTAIDDWCGEHSARSAAVEARGKT